MPILSSSLADKIFNWASIAALITSFAVFLSAGVIYWKSARPATRALKYANFVTIISGGLAFLLGVTVYLASTVKDSYADSRQSNNERLTSLANKIAAEARRQTANIQSENIKLQINLEKERMARLLLESQITPRRLSYIQKSALIQELKRFAGQSIRIISPQNSESNGFAIDFVEVFKKSNWHVIDTNSNSTGVTTVTFDREPQGLHITTISSTQTSSKLYQAAKNIGDGLKKQSFDASLTRKDIGTYPEEKELIELNVGIKPFIERIN